MALHLASSPWLKPWSCMHTRDQSILLLISPIFLSGNSFSLTYYAQDFAQSFNILLKVKLYGKLLNSDIIYLASKANQY